MLVVNKSVIGFYTSINSFSLSFDGRTVKAIVNL